MCEMIWMGCSALRERKISGRKTNDVRLLTGMHSLFTGLRLRNSVASGFGLKILLEERAH